MGEFLQTIPCALLFLGYTFKSIAYICKKQFAQAVRFNRRIDRRKNLQPMAAGCVNLTPGIPVLAISTTCGGQICAEAADRCADNSATDATCGYRADCGTCTSAGDSLFSCCACCQWCDCEKYNKQFFHKIIPAFGVHYADINGLGRVVFFSWLHVVTWPNACDQQYRNSPSCGQAIKNKEMEPYGSVTQSVREGSLKTNLPGRIVKQ